MFQTLRSQILIMVAIPILGLLITSFMSVMDKQETSKKYEVLLPLAQVSIVASEVIHELQKERGKTVGMITADYSDKNVKAVAAQRDLSNPKIEKFKQTVLDTRIKVLDPKLSTFVNAIETEFGKVAAHRGSVDAKNMTVPANVKFYTGIIHKLIALIAQAVEASPSEKLTRDLLPYLALVQAKEASGLERAIGGALFNNAAKDKFATKQFLAYFSKFAEERAFIREFNSVALPEFKELFKKTVVGKDVDQVIEWRKILHALPETKDGKGIDGKVWFDTATKRINLIYKVESEIGKEALRVATGLAEQVQIEQTRLILINFILVVVAVAIGAVVALRIARGLKTVTDDIKELGTGNHQFEVKMQERQDEFGSIARALEVFRKNAEEKEELEAQAHETQKRAERQRKELMVQLAAEFEQTVGRALNQLSAQSTQLEDVSNHLAQKSEHGGSRSLSVAESSIETSTQVETVAHHGVEMAASIREVAQKVNETTTNMQTIVSEVDSAADKISSLQAASQAIGNVVKMITDIAGQTNLLALNATIEAARAGEAGKGFAVVASEVKTLSMQTEQATAQIADEIKSIQEQTTEAVDSIRTVENSIREADEVVASIASAVEEQAATTDQMSENMGDISKAANAVTNDIAYVCQSSAASSGAGIQVLWTVDDLKHVKHDIEQSSRDFLDAMRNAG